MRQGRRGRGCSSRLPPVHGWGLQSADTRPTPPPPAARGAPRRASRAPGEDRPQAPTSTSSTGMPQPASPSQISRPSMGDCRAASARARGSLRRGGAAAAPSASPSVPEKMTIFQGVVCGRSGRAVASALRPRSRVCVRTRAARGRSMGDADAVRTVRMPPASAADPSGSVRSPALRTMRTVRTRSRRSAGDPAPPASHCLRSPAARRDTPKSRFRRVAQARSGPGRLEPSDARAGSGTRRPSPPAASPVGSSTHDPMSTDLPAPSEPVEAPGAPAGTSRAMRACLRGIPGVAIRGYSRLRPVTTRR